MVCIQAGAGIRPQANRPSGGFRRASPAVGRLRRPGLRPASLPSNSAHFPGVRSAPLIPKGPRPRQGSRKGRHTAAGQPPFGRFPAGFARRRPPAAAGPAARSLPSNSTRFPAGSPPSPPGTGKASPCTNANRPRGSYPQAPPGNRQVGLVKIVAALYLLVVLLALPGQD